MPWPLTSLTHILLQVPFPRICMDLGYYPTIVAHLILVTIAYKLLDRADRAAQGNWACVGRKI